MIASSPGGESTNLLVLARVRETALAHNWDLLAAKSGISSAEAQLIMAKEFPNPTLSLSFAKIGSGDASTVLGNSVWHRNYDTIAAVSQLIEIGGKRRDRQDAGRAAVLGARARFYDAKRLLDQGVTKAYIAALLAAENARNLKESAGYLRRQAEIAEAQFAAGDLSESDTHTIEVNAEQFEAQATAAAAIAVQARIAVEILMGIDKPNGHWEAGDKLENLVAISEVNPVSTNSIAGVRSDVLAAEADLRGGRAQLKLQRAIRIPDPTFFVGVEHNPPGGGPPVDTVNFGVSFPLPVWNRNGGAIKAAAAAVEQFELALTKLKAQAAADLANADVAYDEAYHRFLRYRDETVPKSARVRETMSFKYQNGAATLVDYLNAQQTDNAVRLALAQAMNDTASAAADVAAARTSVNETDLVRSK